MISGNRRHLSSILSGMEKAVNGCECDFYIYFLNKFAKISNKLFSHCHYRVCL